MILFSNSSYSLVSYKAVDILPHPRKQEVVACEALLLQKDVMV